MILRLQQSDITHPCIYYILHVHTLHIAFSQLYSKDPNTSCPYFLAIKRTNCKYKRQFLYFAKNNHIQVHLLLMPTVITTVLQNQMLFSIDVAIDVDDINALDLLGIFLSP